VSIVLVVVAPPLAVVVPVCFDLWVKLNLQIGFVLLEAGGPL
jgi:hypothetical protein